MTSKVANNLCDLDSDFKQLNQIGFSMKSIFKLFTVIGVALSLTGCFKVVETGQVGIRTTFTGKIESEELQQGFHLKILSDIKKFSVKQIPIDLSDLKPKASDNLRLQDFDVTVYYTINPAAVSDIYIKYQNSTIQSPDGVYYPAYQLIHNLARSAANDAVSKFPSMQLNEKRLELENNIMASLQSELDAAEKGVFTVDRVNVTNIITDPTVEQSIQKIADTENQKIIARNQLEIAKTQAEEYKIRSESITESILQDKQLDVLMKLATTENRVFVIPQDFKGIVNIGK